jgi:hypothetical protein
MYGLGDAGARRRDPVMRVWCKDGGRPGLGGWAAALRALGLGLARGDDSVA